MEISNFIEKVKYVMPVIRKTKKNSFCTSSEKLFLKDGNFDNNWVGQKVIKPVHTKSFQRIICTKEGGEEKWQLWYGDSRRRWSG